jgi:hypothetical protein
MSRRVDLDGWQHVRDRIRPVQLAILTRDFRPTGPRTLHSHRPRTEEEWQAITDGVRALLDERVDSDRWTWRGPRNLTITGPGAPPPGST